MCGVARIIGERGQSAPRALLYSWKAVWNLRKGMKYVKVCTYLSVYQQSNVQQLVYEVGTTFFSARAFGSSSRSRYKFSRYKFTRHLNRKESSYDSRVPDVTTGSYLRFLFPSIFFLFYFIFIILFHSVEKLRLTKVFTGKRKKNWAPSRTPFLTANLILSTVHQCAENPDLPTRRILTKERDECKLEKLLLFIKHLRRIFFVTNGS